MSSAPGLASRAIAGQGWHDAAFLHWRCDPARVAPLLPPGTRPDLHDGATWVGLIAFDLVDAWVGVPVPVPRFGSFTEVNVRLYAVDERGRPGVVFRSLEAASLPAVLAARALYSLPYRWSRTGHRRSGSSHEYRALLHGAPGRSTLRVRPDLTRSVDDPLSDFLTARWALFVERGGRTRWMPNEHEPWRLHPAVLERLDDDLVGLAGLLGVVDRPPDSVLFSPGVTARFGRPEPLRG